MLTIDSLLSEGKEKIYIFTNSDGKGWAMPSKNIATAMELYQPSGRRGVLLKRLFPRLHWNAAVRNVIGASVRRACLDKELLEAAGNAFGYHDIEYSIFGGTPSVHQKVTIQFFKGKRILGYGKVTDSKAIADLFAHERSLLDSLNRKGIDGIPECLFCNQLPSGLHLFLQSTTKCRGSRSPAQWTSLHEAFMSDLAKRTAVDVPFMESDFYRSLFALQRLISSLPARFGNHIARALTEAYAGFGSTTCRFSAFHGDFTPWNMFVNGDRLFVFDWEYGQMTYPPMLDRYHFHVQQYIHVWHLSAEEIYSRIRENEWFDNNMFRCYLLDVISRFVCRENGNISENLSKMLAIWTGLLALLK